MIQIDVTHLVSEDCSQWSDSVFNSGRDDIGAVTWRRACETAADAPLVGPEGQDELRRWIREFGAWDREEIAAMTDTETNALLLQFVAGDIQEMERFETPEAYRAAQEAGQASSYLWRDDSGRWFFDITN